MTRTLKIQFRLEGVRKRARPANMAMLAEVMRSWSELIESVHQKGPAPAPELHKVIAVEIRAGSHVVMAELPSTHARAVAQVSKAVHQQDLRTLPRESWEAFGLCVKQLQRAHQRLRLVRNDAMQIHEAVLYEALPQPVLQLAKGTSSFVGKLRQVGGVAPTLRLEIDKGRAISVRATEEQAKEIAAVLYQVVVLRVEAEWDIESAEVVSCKLIDWDRGPYRSLQEGAFLMAEHHGDRWVGVDVDQWLRRLRSDEDE